MISHPLNILLADDNQAECILFKEALNKIPLPTELTIVNDGEQLMHLLNKNDYELPDVIFLDLNMPRKSGYQCMAEIKLMEKLKQLPVIILSNVFYEKEGDTLYKNGAQHYIRKPLGFTQFVYIIEHALNSIMLY